MIKILLLLLLSVPVASETIITKSHCDEMRDVLTEMEEYIKEQDAQDIYERCLASL